METTLAVLMVLGIYIGIPAIIGFAIAGVYVFAGRRARRAERAQALEGAVRVAEEMVGEAHSEQAAQATPKEPVEVR